MTSPRVPVHPGRPLKSHAATLALLCVSPICHAQSTSTIPTSSVNLYGVLDIAYVNQGGHADKADGSSSGPIVKNAIQGGVSRGTRVGFRGTEELGGGLRGIFAVEMGFYLDTGVSSQGAPALNQYPAGPLFGRQAFVGLSGKYGKLTLGRQYTPSFYVTFIGDPFQQGMAGAMTNLQNNTNRANNAVVYVTPDFQGLTASGMYAFGEVPGDTSSGRQYSANLLYQKGNINAGVGYYNITNITSTAAARTITFAGSYNVGFSVLYADYQIQRSNLNGNPGSPVLGGERTYTNTDSFLIGASFPFGRHEFMVSYIRNLDKRDVSNANRNADQFAVGYKYSLSKRTYIYSAYGYLRNMNGASYTIGDALYGSGNATRAFNLGLSHTF